MKDWRDHFTQCPVCGVPVSPGRKFCSRRHKDTKPPPTNWENARWVKGPYVALFLERHGIKLGDLTENQERRVMCWRDGSNADFYKVDEILTSLGFHPYQLQMEFGSEVWCQFHEKSQSFPLLESDQGIAA